MKSKKMMNKQNYLMKTTKTKTKMKTNKKTKKKMMKMLFLLEKLQYIQETD